MYLALNVLGIQNEQMNERINYAILLAVIFKIAEVLLISSIQECTMHLEAPGF